MNNNLGRFIYYGLQYLRQEPVNKVLKGIKETEFLPSEGLRNNQFQRLKNLLQYAISYVPYYKTNYQMFSKDIYNINSWDDAKKVMQEIPLLDKDVVRNNKSLFTSGEINKLKTYPDKTSGSSGTPLIFACDQMSWAFRHALYIRCTESFNVQAGERYIYFYGLHWNKRSKLLLKFRDYLLNRVRVSAYDISPDTFLQHLGNIKKFKPTHFLGYPSAIYDFCVLAFNRGIDLHDLHIKAIFLTSEPVYLFQKELIEKVTGAICVDFYGSAEGGLNAFQCPHGNLHLAVESTWVVSKPNNEILVTDMFLRAFPMINYDIGDEMIFDHDYKCSCGRSHPVIRQIIGRSGEPIVLPNGKRINSHLPGYIFKPLSGLGVIRSFRFVLSKEKKLSLYLVVTSDYKAEYENIIRKETKNAFGHNIEFDIIIQDALPFLPNAKHKSFVIEH